MCVFTVFHSTVTIGELVLFLFKLDFYRNSKVYNLNGNEAKSMYTKSLSRIYLKFSLRPLFLFFLPFSVANKFLQLLASQTGGR